MTGANVDVKAAPSIPIARAASFLVSASFQIARKPHHARILGMSRLLCTLLLIGCLVPAFGQQDTEPCKIEYLINSIADLRDATFIRNGSEYSARQAADHLRAKLGVAGGRAGTAADFIVCCATGSSISGEKYRIKFADGRFVDAAAFLRDKLAAYPGSHCDVPLPGGQPPAKTDQAHLP